MLSENLDRPITPYKIYIPNRFGKINESIITITILNYCGKIKKLR